MITAVSYSIVQVGTKESYQIPNSRNKLHFNLKAITDNDLAVASAECYPEL